MSRKISFECRRVALNHLTRLRHKTATLVAVVKPDGSLAPGKSSDHVSWRRETNRVRRDAAMAAWKDAVEVARDLSGSLHTIEATSGDELTELVSTIIQTLATVERPMLDTHEDPANETAFSAITHFAKRAHVLVGIAAKLLRDDF